MEDGEATSTTAVASSAPPPEPPSTVTKKKKRGRPRKYGPDGSVVTPLSPVPISASMPPGEFTLTSPDGTVLKRARGRPSGSPNKVPRMIESHHIGELIPCSARGNFTPHIITVAAGEDVTMKVISFSQQAHRAICILSANGVISNVTLRQPDSSGGTLTYEGRFELLSLSGSFMLTETGGTKSRSGGLSVALASPDGRVVGGGVAGLLVAASPVQVIVGSFMPNNQTELKANKSGLESFTIDVSTTMQPISSIGGDGPYSIGQVQLSSVAPKPVSLTAPSTERGEIWDPLHSVSVSATRSVTDIDISLPGG